MEKNRYVSIDIGGTEIKYASIKTSGDIITLAKTKTPSTLSDLQKLLKKIIEKFKSGLKGIVVSCPGKIDSEGTVHFGGSLPYLHNVPLKKYLTDTFHVPSAVINDGKSAALAEFWLGNLKNVANGVAIVLGTGIGGGIIINGQLFQGSHFQAGEFSLIMSKKNEPQTFEFMGNEGSAVQFIRVASKILDLNDLNNGPLVFEKLKQGENDKLNLLFENYCLIIAQLICNLQVVLDFERVVIGGGISAQKILIEEINHQYINLRQNNTFFSRMIPDIDILPCKFQNNANLVGALYHLLQEN
ncbi:ROK family protein [Vagococcus elongatus]|uniref:ROK family protein n=1 Tax=Vagococcus elongatus TaxID=180344 RepID=A0A430B4E8_9ENTE|nr:ROK family protein [Vagococcus elongatus]RSU15179.1 hypothetical protein CBF29_02265 [Vagococcus elongatus]